MAYPVVATPPAPGVPPARVALTRVPLALAGYPVEMQLGEYAGLFSFVGKAVKGIGKAVGKVAGVAGGLIPGPIGAAVSVAGGALAGKKKPPVPKPPIRGNQVPGMSRPGPAPRPIPSILVGRRPRPWMPGVVSGGSSTAPIVQPQGGGGGGGGVFPFAPAPAEAAVGGEDTIAGIPTKTLLLGGAALLGASLLLGRRR